MSHSATFYKIKDILRSAPKPVTDDVLLEVASLAIAETLGERASEPVKWDSKINDDLGLDSLDTVELVMFLEECFSVEIRCLLYTSPSPRDRQKSRMPSSA